MNGNENSKIIIINTKNSNIGSIEDDDSYRNELYKLLYQKYGLDVKMFQYIVYGIEIDALIDTINLIIYY